MPAVLWSAAGFLVDVGQSILKFDWRLAHPVLGPDLFEPILDCWNATAVFLDVLFTDPSHRNHPARAVLDGMAEDPLALEDALGMMP